MAMPSRAGYRCQLTKIAKAAEEYLASEGSVINPENSASFDAIEEELAVFLERLKSVRNNLNIANEGISANIKDEDRERECEAIAEYDDKAVSAIARINKRLEKIRRVQGLSMNCTNSCETPRNVCSVRLPKLELKRFTGDYNEWQPFWDQFRSAVHENRTLGGAEKFNYLQSVLSGRAAETIAGFTPSDSCYENAISLLREEFGDTEKIIDRILQQLMALKTVPMKNDAIGLRRLYNTVTTSTRSLTTLGVPATHYLIMLKSILLKCLPSETRVGFHRSYDDALEEETVSKNEINSDADGESSIGFRGDKQVEALLRYLKREVDSLERSAFEQPTLKRVTPPRFASYATAEPSNKGCEFCKETHHSPFKCNTLLQKSPSDRFAAVKALNLCINCLKNGHTVRTCKSRGCQHCAKPHHTLLHLPTDAVQHSPSLPASINTSVHAATLGSVTVPLPSRSEDSSSPSSNDQGSSFLTSKSAQSRQKPIIQRQVILATALVDVETSYGTFITCRALLDSASQINFITQRIVQKLGLHPNSTSTQIMGIGNSRSKSSGKTEILVRSRANNFSARLEVQILPHISSNLPTQYFDISSMTIPQNIALADPAFNTPQRIDILIGASLFFELLSVGRIRLNQQAILQKTIFGWIFSGSIVTGSTCLFSAENPSEELNDIVSKFWEIERSDSSKKSFSAEELACESHFLDNVQRSESGRFIVRLPFRKPPLTLGNSYNVALVRYNKLEIRLARSPKLKEDYTAFMHEYLDLNHMEEISLAELEPPMYFLPHHAVIKADSSSTKLRVVFDGSCKTSSGDSLNSILMVGPTMQDDLFTIMVRFRLYAYALSSDIVKMYRQIQVAAPDDNLQCILWRENLDSPVRIFRLKTVTYGTSSAAYLSIRCMRQLAMEETDKFPLGAYHVLNNFYVDNLMCGADSLQNLSAIKQEVMELLSLGGFKLRKWCCNSAEILNDIDKGDREPLMRLNSDDVVKALGLFWSPDADEFVFHYEETTQNTVHVTKRLVLAQIAKLFDPLGFIQPITVRAKMFLQRLWQHKLDWDEGLPSDLHAQWTEMQGQLHLINSIRVRRFASVSNARVQLHGFCDASQGAYGACIYLRSEDGHGKIHVELLCAKSRVAPVRTESLARLELCGALLLAELLERVSSALTKEIEERFCWSDSTIALAWISSTPNKWSTFVANRVSKIQQLTELCSWNHVPGRYNPADLLSRGCLPEELLKCRTWLNGPHFLRLDCKSWPRPSISSDVEVPEHKNEKYSFACCKSNKTDDITQDCKFSNSFMRIVRVFSFVLRFLWSKNKPKPNSLRISTNEFEAAFKAIIRNLQETFLSTEYKCLAEGKEIPSSSRILRLNPFMGPDQLIRVGGRLRRSDLPFDSKHQIILVQCHPFTDAIIRHYHEQNLHAGCQAVLNTIRQRLWIINGTRAVSKVIRRCITCFRSQPRLASQIMADQQLDRLRPSRPFTVTGVDFCGPIYLTQRIRGRPPTKGYIAVFICFSVKAVHLEVVPDLTTQSFLAALRRFISRRGKCARLYSDNATNFVGARNELKDLREHLLSLNHIEAVENFALSEGIDWAFIPPRSPHFGGLWEAAVKIAKRHLNKVVATTSNFSFTYEEMNTLICQIEAIMNSRPISALSNDPNDFEALTPGHFLIGAPLTSFADAEASPNLNRLSHYQRIQFMQQEFWQRWRKEYIQMMQSRGKWLRSQPNIQVGELVLIKDDHLPPLKWPMGRIISTHQGNDNKIRVVGIKTANGVVKRAITRVAILPLPETTAEPLAAANNDEDNRGAK